MAELRVPLGDTIRGVEDVRPKLAQELANARETKRLLDEKYAVDAAAVQARIDALSAQLSEADAFIAWKAAQA